MPNAKTQKGHAKAEPSRANSREDNDNPGVMSPRKNEEKPRSSERPDAPSEAAWIVFCGVLCGAPFFHVLLLENYSLFNGVNGNLSTFV